MHGNYFRRVRRGAHCAVLAILFLSGVSAGGEAGPLDPEAIAKASGVRPTVETDGVIRIGWVRDDVEVSVDGRRLPPAAGLGSWAAFKATPDGAMLMGDTVVFEDEITPAMDAAFAHGLDVTGLHNHFVFDRPPVYFMHIGAHGGAAELAAGVAAVWDAIREVREALAEPRDSFPGRPVAASGDLDADAIERVLGSEPSVNGGVVKFTFARSGRMHGVKIGSSMGLSTWAAFVGKPSSATVDGDFIMTAPEVQLVLRALRKADIHIVALHNHMIGEEPPFYFLHYWGKGTASELATGVKAALDAQLSVARQ